MAGQERMPTEEVVRKVMLDEHADVLRESLKLLVRELMEVEVSELVGAELGERRPEDRATHRNGYRPRRWDTRAGEAHGTLAEAWSGVFPEERQVHSQSLAFAGAVLLALIPTASRRGFERAVRYSLQVRYCYSPFTSSNWLKTIDPNGAGRSKNRSRIGGQHLGATLSASWRSPSASRII